MAAVHFRDLLVDDVLPQRVAITLLCLRPSLVVAGQWHRLFTGALLHADDRHLYYNMVSFLVHGAALEPQLGTAAYGFLLLRLTVLCGAIHTALAYFLELESFNSCCVGWSAVLFALKTIITADGSGTASVGPWTVPLKVAAWGELLWISFLNPRASFVGHLSGILAGMADRWVTLFISSLMRPRTRARPRRAPNSEPTRPRTTPSSDEAEARQRRVDYLARQEALRRQRGW